MSALQDRFAQAQEDVNGLAERPDNNTMLKLYALYKQATQGDATGERPGGFDFIAPPSSMPGARSKARPLRMPCSSTSTWLLPSGAETVPAFGILSSMLGHSLSRQSPPLRRAHLSLFKLVSSPEYLLCGRSLWTAMPRAFFCPISTSSRLPRVIPV